MKALLAMLLLLGTVAAFAAELPCFVGFATLAEDADGPRLTSMTYAGLLDRIGAGRFTAETLTKLREQENPFEIPDQRGTDFSVLQIQMRRLEAMVREKNWFTEPVLQQLRAGLDARLAGLRQAEQKLEVAHALAWPDYEIPMPNYSGGDFSHDGKWIVTSTRQRGSDPTQAWQLAVHDVEKKTTVLFDAPTYDMSDPTFSQDGSKLIFKLVGQRLVVVPFANGRPEWRQAYSIGDTEFGGGKSNYVLQGFGSRYVVAGEWVPDLFLFDFASRTRVPLRILDVLSAAERREKEHFPQDNFGVVPGTSDFYLRRVVKPDRERLRTFQVMTDGRLVQKSEIWTRKLPRPDDKGRAERAFFFLPDGRPVTVQGDSDKTNFTFRVGAEEKEFSFEVPASLGPTAAPGSEFSIRVNPTRPEVAVVVKSGDFKKQWVVFYDFSKGAVVGSIEVPYRSIIEYSPDGTRLYAETGIRETGNYHAINYRGRLSE